MIKLKIAGETPPEPRTIEFELRRHEMAKHNTTDAETAFLVANILNQPEKAYVIKVDGRRQLVEVRKRDLESLGFTVVIKD